MAKRGKLEIIKDILRIIKSHRNMIKPTPLLRKSRMSSKRFKEYYTDLVLRGLIHEIRHDDQIKYLALTDKGIKFLDRYNTILEFIDEFEL